MTKPFRELPATPIFDRWVKGFFRYIELVVICAALAVAAKKSMSLWLILPSVLALGGLLAWTFFGVLREVARVANDKAPKQGNTWHIFVAIVAVIVAAAWAYMGTLQMLSVLANLPAAAGT